MNIENEGLTEEVMVDGSVKKEDEPAGQTLPGRVRIFAARWTGTLAVAVLLFSVIVFVWMWVRAFQTGAIPETEWGIKDGNHGPWRHRDFRGAWWLIVDAQFWAFMLSVVSLCIKPNRKAGIVAVTALVWGLIFMFTHFWLVD